MLYVTLDADAVVLRVAPLIPERRYVKAHTGGAALFGCVKKQSQHKDSSSSRQYCRISV